MTLFDELLLDKLREVSPDACEFRMLAPPNEAMLRLTSLVLSEVQRIENATGKRPTAAIVSPEDWPLGEAVSARIECHGVSIACSALAPRGAIYLMVRP